MTGNRVITFRKKERKRSKTLGRRKAPNPGKGGRSFGQIVVKV